MPRLKLTAAAVQRLKAPKAGQIDYFDAAYPGLALRVTSKGVRSWTYFGRVNGKLKRATVGRYPDLSLSDARKKAGETADAMRAGTDPTLAKRQARKAASEATRDSVRAVGAEWLKRDQASNRSHDEVKRILEHDVYPVWGDRKIQSITRRDVIELIDAIVDRGSVVMARRIHAHLHRLFRWSVARGVLGTNPMTDLPKPGRETRRDRVLDDAELREVWLAAGKIGYPFGPAIQMLILTGARRQEIGALAWSEIDLDERAIVLPSERSKSGVSRTIPLSTAALDILESLPRLEPETGVPDYVFSTTGRTPISGWSRAKRLLDENVVTARQETIDNGEAEPMPQWQIHDLRRSLATGLQRIGSRLEVIEAVLGHVGGSRAGIVGVYQRHSYEDEKRDALETWGRHIEQLVDDRKSSRNVVRLRR